MKKNSISCELHGYLEIACLYGYRVKLTLKDRKTIEGLAINIITTAEKREFLLIENEGIHKIDLNQLSKMKVLTPNAKFSEVIFCGNNRIKSYFN
jgi:Rho-binding antiterminator